MKYNRKIAFPAIKNVSYLSCYNWRSIKKKNQLLISIKDDTVPYILFFLYTVSRRIARYKGSFI
jgi:hypothetical protein